MIDNSNIFNYISKNVDNNTFDNGHNNYNKKALNIRELMALDGHHMIGIANLAYLEQTLKFKEQSPKANNRDNNSSNSKNNKNKEKNKKTNRDKGQFIGIYSQFDRKLHHNIHNDIDNGSVSKVHKIDSKYSKKQIDSNDTLSLRKHELLTIEINKIKNTIKFIRYLKVLNNEKTNDKNIKIKSKNKNKKTRYNILNTYNSTDSNSGSSGSDDSDYYTKDNALNTDNGRTGQKYKKYKKYKSNNNCNPSDVSISDGNINTTSNGCTIANNEKMEKEKEEKKEKINKSDMFVTQKHVIEMSLDSKDSFPHLMHDENNSNNSENESCLDKMKKIDRETSWYPVVILQVSQVSTYMFSERNKDFISIKFHKGNSF